MIAANPGNLSSSPRRISELPLTSLLGIGSLFLIAFANLISLPDSDQDTTTSLDLQSLVKLALIGGLWLYSIHRLWVDPRVIRALFATPGVMLLGVGLLLIATSAFSIKPLVSLASALSTFACVLGAVSAGIQFGPNRVIQLGFWACAFFLGASAVYWLVLPHAAMFAEPLEQGQFKIRYAGLSHPNTVGQYGAMGLVLLITWYFPSHRGKRERWLGVLIGILAVGSLAAAMSRTAILALVLSLAFGYRKSLLRGRSLLAILVLTTVAIGGLSILSVIPNLGDKVGETLVKSLSKSGDVNELTTGTGRNEIWAESLRLIALRPWTGYGAATSKELLQDFTRYTHNMVLNVSLSAGIFAGFLLLVAFGYGFRNAFRSPNVIADSLFACIFLNGLAENVCFQVIDSAPMLLMTIALVWRNIEVLATQPNQQLDPNLVRQSPSGWEGAQS